MTEQSNLPEPQAEFTLVDLLTAIGEEKTLIAGITALAGAVGLAVALLLPTIYTAKTTLLPPQQSQNASAGMAASLGALAASTGIAAAFKTPEELYVGLLKTDTVATAPDRKSKPRRAFIVLGCAAAGLLAGLMLAFVRRSLRQMREDPATTGQWDALASAWIGRSKLRAHKVMD